MRVLDWCSYELCHGKIGRVYFLGNTTTTTPNGYHPSGSYGNDLHLPLSAPALAIMLQLSGLAAGAATIGCCCNMIGFALAGYKDNGVFGLIAIGLGTSKLQFPKILQHPMIWLPSILSSAILGPISVLVAKMTNSTAGAGLGTTVLLGPIMSWQTMAPTQD